MLSAARAAARLRFLSSSQTLGRLGPLSGTPPGPRDQARFHCPVEQRATTSRSALLPALPTGKATYRRIALGSGAGASCRGHGSEGGNRLLMNPHRVLGNSTLRRTAARRRLALLRLGVDAGRMRPASRTSWLPPIQAIRATQATYSSRNDLLLLPRDPANPYNPISQV